MNELSAVFVRLTNLTLMIYRGLLLLLLYANIISEKNMLLVIILYWRLAIK